MGVFGEACLGAQSAGAREHYPRHLAGSVRDGAIRRFHQLMAEISLHQDIVARPRVQVQNLSSQLRSAGTTTNPCSRPSRSRSSRSGILDITLDAPSNTSPVRAESQVTVPSRTSTRPSGSFDGIARTSERPGWTRNYLARPVPQTATVADFSNISAIRGLEAELSWVDEVGYSPAWATWPTNATFTIPDDSSKIARWNTVWAEIGEAYNKKVMCQVEG